MTRVLLVTMPFGGCLTPSLGISLLRQEIIRKGHACELRYLNLPYAARIGVDLYGYLANSFPTILLGEWLFAKALFGDEFSDPEAYVTEILHEYVRQHGREIPAWVMTRLTDLRRWNEEYLDECLTTTDWESYDVIGFTSTFEQNLASLALAKRIKARWEDKVIVFGGANWEGEMGLELLRHFPFVDYACSGEADWLFPELVARLAVGQKPPALPGLFSRHGEAVHAVGNHALGIDDMDSLPFVDFHDYFEQLAISGLAYNPENVSLLLETSRGCWWGARSQCTFCGLNGGTMSYRSKSGERVLEEFRRLARDYPQTRNVFVVDNILDLDYFSDVLPVLAQEQLGISISYEVKANLKKEQMRLLKAAGVHNIQPGIESLDSELLRLVAKGCTSSQNIQLLKWAHKFDIQADWNMLAGIPGATEEAYERMAVLLPSLVHLQPPSSRGVSWLRLDRFSPYFEKPQEYGVVNVRPVEAYRYIYPFPDESLHKIAYYFDFDELEARPTRPAIELLHRTIEGWHDQVEPPDGRPRPVLNSISRDGQIVIQDTRPVAVQSQFTLEGLEKEIYEFCEEGRSLAAIQRRLASREAGEAIGEEELLPILEKLVSWGLMLGPSSPGFSDDRYLSLAVPIDEQADALAASLFASLFSLDQGGG